MRLLKQSTAVVIPFGPFLDKTDGVTLEVGLVSAIDHASTGIMLSKNGGALAVRHAAVTASTYDAHGCYVVTLDTTDTNALGTLRAIYTDAATCLPVWEDFMVITANAWDTLCGAALFGIDVVNWKASAAPAMTGDSFARLGAPAGASVSADVAALTGTGGVKIGTDALDANALKTDAVTEIVNAIKAAVVEAEGSYTIQQVLSIVLAVMAGVTATGGTVLKTPNGAATRVSATLNTSSERTAMTLTPSA